MLLEVAIGKKMAFIAKNPLMRPTSIYWRIWNWMKSMENEKRALGLLLAIV
jgi:hypothetical protein